MVLTIKGKLYSYNALVVKIKKCLEYKGHSEPIICIQGLKYLKKNDPDRQFF